jgi:hypothetical protein
MPDLSHFEQRVGELRLGLAQVSPQLLASRAGSVFLPEESEFSISLWGREQLITYPGFVCRDAISGRVDPLAVQALLLYYLQSADGAPLAGRWVSFADLPGGRFYNQAFQGYTGGELRRHFNVRQNDVRHFGGGPAETFSAAASALGGSPQPTGDRAFAFQALPRLPVLVVHWQGDEDFPSSFQLLFDASAIHYLPIDVCAILGSMLTRRLIAFQNE